LVGLTPFYSLDDRAFTSRFDLSRCAELWPGGRDLLCLFLFGYEDASPHSIGCRHCSPAIYQVIDLGLAKTLDESDSEGEISSPGAFVGTPEFASPEQFAGVGVDIRSDLYSLGINALDDGGWPDTIPRSFR
jgi:serine/threonine protein kinase